MSSLSMTHAPQRPQSHTRSETPGTATARQRFARWSVRSAAALALLLLVTGCSGESPEALLQSAKTHLGNNEQNEAIIQLKNVLQQAPDSAEARYLLGKVLLDSGDAAGAAVELRKARSLGYSDDAVVPALAQALVAQGQWKAVTDELADVRLSNRTAAADLQVAVAQAYAGRKLQELAENAVRSALNAQPNHAGAQVMQARLLAGKGDLRGAMAAVDATLQAHPQEAAAWTLKGRLLVTTGGDLEAALGAYRKAIAIDERNLEAHDGALTILSERNDAALLKAQLAELVKVFPKQRQTRYFQARLAYMQGDFDATRKTIQSLVTSSSDEFRVLLLAGAVEFQAGSLASAENHLTKALQVNPSSVVAGRLLAQTYLRSGQPEKALTAVQPALLVRNPDAQALAVAAEAHLLQGDLGRAGELFGKSAKLNPQDVRSRTALALMEMDRGNAGVGLQQLEALAAEDRGSLADLALISAHLRRKEHAAALKAIEALQKKQPGKPLPEYLRGRVQLAMKKPAEARGSFERALAAEPLYVPAVGSLAALDMADGKADAARQRFRAVLDKDPKNVPSLLALAELTVRSRGSKDEVTKLLNAAVEAAPQEPRPRLMLIEYLVSRNDLRAAMTAAQAGVAAIPTNAQLLDALGRVQLASGDANQAVTTFTQVAAMRPRSPDPLLRLAVAHRANGDLAAARRAVAKALSIQPDLLMAQQQLAALEMASNEPQQALAVARTVQKQRPAQAIGYVLEGEVKSTLKDFLAAEAAFRLALSKEPGNLEVMARLHSALTDAGKVADADRLASAWLKEHPSDWRFIARLGDNALKRQDYVRAEDLYRRALDRSPDSASVLNNLAWVLAHQAKPGAVEAAEKVNSLAPDQPAYMDTLAYALAMTGQVDRAVELQKTVIALQPAVWSYRLGLAKIYIKAGRKSDAETELNELAKLGDKFGGQAEVAQLLKSLKES
jgi:putative PEP-CTERM system TPR-repeat lipoprotein